MMKRGMLFTVSAASLMIAITLISASYMVRNRNTERLAIASMAGLRMDQITYDIGNRMHQEILKTNISVRRRAGYVTITIVQPDIMSAVDHYRKMMDYRNFVETAYAAMNGVGIRLPGLDNTLRIEPFGAVMQVNGTAFRFYVGDKQALVNISLSVSVNETLPEDKLGIPEEDPGQPIVDANYSRNGSSILFGTRPQHPDQKNAEFYKSFRTDSPPIKHDVSYISSQFGSEGTDTGALRVDVYNLHANITRLDITYTAPNSTVRVLAGNISISYPIIGMTKETEIVVAQG